MSASVHCGSSRVQLVIDDVVGAPEKVVFEPGGTTIGGCGCTANGVRDLAGRAERVDRANGERVLVPGWSAAAAG